MKSKLFASVLACLVTALSVRGEILMYEGFPTGEGGYPTTAHGETRNAVRRTLDEYVLSGRNASVCQAARREGEHCRTRHSNFRRCGGYRIQQKYALTKDGKRRIERVAPL
jgi:hypothetical protein